MTTEEQLKSFRIWADGMEDIMLSGQGQFNNKKTWAAWKAGQAKLTKDKVTSPSAFYDSSVGGFYISYESIPKNCKDTHKIEPLFKGTVEMMDLVVKNKDLEDKLKSAQFQLKLLGT